jgi:hypothetical protein
MLDAQSKALHGAKMDASWIVQKLEYKGGEAPLSKSLEDMANGDVLVAHVAQDIVTSQCSLL